MLNSDDRRNLALARQELIGGKDSRSRQRGALVLSAALIGLLAAVAWNEGFLLPRDSNAQTHWQGEQRTFSVPYDAAVPRPVERSNN